MKVLVAEDSLAFANAIEHLLRKWDFEPILVQDGERAWEMLQRPDSEMLALLDWELPGLEGPELCQKVRQLPHGDRFYLILVTVRDSSEDIVRGLEMGANDFVTKPYDPNELRARVQVGARVAQLQSQLSRRVQELEEALQQIQKLQSLLPICSYCKSVRSDSDYWEKVETYIARHTDTQLTHTICPQCYHRVATEVKAELERSRIQLKPEADPQDQE